MLDIESTEWVKATKSGAAGNCLQVRWMKASKSGPNGNCLEAKFTSADKSNGNGGSNCVEAAFLEDSVQMRDSKHPDGPVWTFTPAEWDAFLDGAKKGEFDLPPGTAV